MPGPISDYYPQAVALFEAGRLEESLEHFEAFLKERPISGAAWNGAGTVLFRLGQVEKAARYFVRSLEQQDRPAEAWRNLICSYLVLGKPGKAMRLLKTVDHEVHADISLVCRTGRAFEQQCDPASAMRILHFGKRLGGDMTMLLEQIEQLRSRRAKVAFFAGDGDPGPLEAVIEYTRQRYPVRVYAGQDAAEICGLMKWADVCWFEGCGEVTETGTHGSAACKTIVRVRESDAETRFEAICWNRVDAIVASGCLPTVQRLERCPEFRRRGAVVTIADGIDVEKITFRRRGRGKTIAVAADGDCPGDLVLCASALLKRDSGYRFYLTGADDQAVREAIVHQARQFNIENSLCFLDPGTNCRDWPENMSFVVSTGDTETGRRTVLEAMACGIKPVVRDFPGAKDVFGKNYLFRTPEEFCERILEKDYDSEAYRYFVERRCPLSRSLLQIDELFAWFEAGAKGVAAEMTVQEAANVSAAV